MDTEYIKRNLNSDPAWVNKLFREACARFMDSSKIADKINVEIEKNGTTINMRINGNPVDDRGNVTILNPTFRNKEVLLMAANELGVYEWKDGSNPRVEQYLDHGASKSNKDSGLDDSIPWCAGFIAFCLESVGMQSSDSLMARSYEKWGKSSKIDPLPGDIVTFYRNGLSSGQGHVAFLVKFTPQWVWCLGGNQNDEVNVTRYSTDRMTDIRRSSKEFALSDLQRKMLAEIAADILAGNKVAEAGKVT